MIYSMTQNCQRSVVQLDLEPPRPYNAGVCGSCLTVADDAPVFDRCSVPDRVNASMKPNRVYSGLPSTSRNNNNNKNNTPIAVDDRDVATLTCSRLRKAIGDQSTFCSLVDDQCPTQCGRSSDCGDASDCKACSQ